MGAASSTIIMALILEASIALHARSLRNPVMYRETRASSQLIMTRASGRARAAQRTLTLLEIDLKLGARGKSSAHRSSPTEREQL